ncbi:MAG: PAS domain S-box protein [Bacteroidota bacterium]
MKNSKFLDFVTKPVFIGLLVFCFLLLLTQYLAYERYLLVRETETRELNNEANAAKERIQTILSYNLSTAQTLAFIVQKYGVPNDFDSVGATLLRSNKFVDAVQLVEGSVITHVYPREGNEVIIGYDILKDSVQNSGVLTTIKTKHFFWAGPIKLKQGGIGIVGRQPLFKDNKFKGFSAVIIRLSTFLKAVGIDSNTTNGFYYQLSRANDDGSEVFFLQNHQSYKNALVVPAKIPNGEWKLYVGTKNRATLFFALTFSLLGIILSISGGLFSWYFARQPKELSKLVEEKTRQLSTAFTEKGIALSRITDAVLSVDINGHITFVNQTAQQRLFVENKPVDSEHEIIGKKVWDVYKGVRETIFWKKFQETLRTQKNIEVEGFFEPTNRWLLMKMYPSSDGITIYSRDISESKKAEQEILFEKNLSDSIINTLPGIFYLYDRSGKFIRWNKNFETISGYSAEEIGSDNPPDFFDTQEKKVVVEKIKEATQTGIADAEVQFYTKDKKKIPYYFNGRAVNLYGKDYLIGMGIDISKRKKAEQGVIQSEEQYRSLIENLPDIIMRLDLEEKVQFINYTEGGFTREQIIGSSAYNFVLPEYHDLVREKHRKVIATKTSQSYETVSVGHDGIKRWFLTNVGPIIVQGKVSGITLITRDISERKRIEQQILEEKNLSVSIINSLPGIFYLYDRNGKFIRCNKNFETISGYTWDEISTMHPLDFFDLDEKQLLMTKINEVFEKGSSDVEACFFTKTKTKIPYYFTGHIATIDGFDYLIGMGIDITESQKAQKEIIIEKNLSESIINSLPGVFYMADVNGNLLRWNKNFEFVSGYGRVELENMRVAQFVDVDEQPNLLLKKQLAISEGVSDTEANFLTKQKQKIPYHFTSVLATYEEQPRLLGVGIDITERKKAEEEIQKSRSELRQLSAYLQTIREEERTGIAREIHDELGQQLTALKMDTSWLTRKIVAEDEVLHEKLSGMTTLIDDTVKTVRRISTGLRPGILDDLGLIAALEWQSGEFKKRAGIPCYVTTNLEDTFLEKNISTGIFRVYQEALTNIMRHAQATLVETSILKVNSSLVVSIRDNGKGFDIHEVKTKNTLGILGMKERALMFGGELDIKSKKGEGTEIILKVPLSSHDNPQA